jgi:hypothetical protein
MTSLTKKTEAHRRRKRATNGRDKKKARAKASTPKFPVHPEKK